MDKTEDSLYYFNMTDSIKAKIAIGKDFAWRLKSIDGTDATMRTSAHPDPVYQPTILLTGTATSISNLSTADNFLVYPNPAKGSMAVQLENRTSGIVKLYNIAGSQVLISKISSSKTQLDVTQINSGIYFLTVESNGVLLGREKVVIR